MVRVWHLENRGAEGMDGLRCGIPLGSFPESFFDFFTLKTAFFDGLKLYKYTQNEYCENRGKCVED